MRFERSAAKLQDTRTFPALDPDLPLACTLTDAVVHWPRRAEWSRRGAGALVSIAEDADKNPMVLTILFDDLNGPKPPNTCSGGSKEPHSFVIISFEHIFSHAPLAVLYDIHIQLQLSGRR